MEGGEKDGKLTKIAPFFSILFTAACVLPSAMGLTLNTPPDVAADGTLAASWTPAAGDPYVFPHSLTLSPP